MTKVLVSLDERLLRRVDRAAHDRGLSRSAYLSELAETELNREAPGTTSAVRTALRALDELFADGRSDESTQAIRNARDSR